MRITLVVIFFISLAWSAFANDSDAYCAQIGHTANSVMQARQSGLEMSQLMDAASKSGDATGNQNLVSMARKLIVLAYQSPRYSTNEMKTKSIQEFTNEAELACYQVQK